jgi:hypothetical protein
MLRFMDPALARAITSTALGLGIDPIDLATVISYETAGTFDPWKAGPTTRWGQHRGLIQWGEPQAQQYGVSQEMPVDQQMGAVARYLRDAGLQPGMGILDLYSAINAGQVGRYGASDGPGNTVRSHVENMNATHRPRAAAAMGGSASAPSVGPTRAAAAGMDPSNPLNRTASAPAPSTTPAATPPPQSPLAAAFQSFASSMQPPLGGPNEPRLSISSGPFAASMQADQSRQNIGQLKDFLMPVAEDLSTSPAPLAIPGEAPPVFGPPKAQQPGIFGQFRARPAPLGPGMRLRA